MPTTDELVAIVAGSLAGFIVLIIIISVILYCIFGKRKEKNRDPDKFNQFTPSTDHSKPSTLSQGAGDPRLPKVGSNGLWMGAPTTMYAPGPAQAYLMDQQACRGMQKWSSETRLPGGPGHMVYDGNSRIYHSHQQMAPVYNAYPAPRAAGYVEALPYSHHYETQTDASHSRTMLIEYPDYGEYYHPFQNQELTRNNRVRRSKSDVVSHSNRKPRHAKHRNDSPDPKRQEPITTAEIHAHKQHGAPPSPLPKPVHRSVSPQKGSSHHQNVSLQKSYEAQTKSINVPDTGLLPSATDSAKLRAVSGKKDSKKHWNITDDDKRTVPEPVGQPKYQNESNLTHPQHQSDVYAVPDKSKSKSIKYENSVVTKTDDIPKDKENERPYLQQISASVEVGDYRSHHPIVNKKLSSEYHALSKSNASASDPPVRETRKARGSEVNRHESVDLAREGKNVTTQAFEFLESYLSDEEMDNIETGKHTPLHGHVNKGADLSF